MNPPRYRYSKVRVLLLIIFLLLLASFLVYGGFRVYERFFPRDISSKDVAGLVSELAEVPEGEIPTIYAIMDTKDLRNQPFFKNVEVGDKVLIYHKAKMAYLFRPRTGKLISIAPLSN